MSYSWRDSSFSKLFSYISGNNERGLKIPMTAPVLSMYTPERGMFNNQWTMSEMLFMVPHNMRRYAPQPNDPTVYLKMLPEMDVYVKSYGGYSNYRTKLAKFRELKNEIDNRYLYNNNAFLSAGYNGPSDPYNMRHNEIWLVARR
ncbi:heme-binding protein 2-like [Saccostrea echinata]|uniref:heme-binding protein 2-like n=1 Tax=Saccostrea echinata TaxID=191078 RepID=UPI002A802F3F|nr:heme-binding protein 2-like [Saccostrea echinata]